MYICTTRAHTPKHFNPSPSRCWTFHRNLVAKTIAGVVLILWWIRNNLRKMSIYTDTHNTESAIHQFSSVQFSRLVVSNSCDPMDRSMPGLPVHHQLPEFTQTHVHWVGDAIQPSHPCHPLLLLPSIFPSIRVFSNESVLLIRWPKHWSFSFSISPSNEYSGLISFRIDWFDILAVQGTLKSLLQHHSSKASILRHSTFFMVQLWPPYMTTGKTVALTIRTFVGNVNVSAF